MAEGIIVNNCTSSKETKPPTKYRDKLDLTGRRFGKLVVLGAGPRRDGKRQWYCRCDCGQEVLAEHHHLYYMGKAHCGCSDTRGKNRRTHGMAHSKIYSVWGGMIRRCTKPSRADYVYYGKRGITVCERWRIFENFLADMGPTYATGLSLERRDNSGNYEPSNACWTTHQEQCNNTRRNHYITVGTETLTVAQWARRMGVEARVIFHRLDRGWDPVVAIMKPVFHPATITAYGLTLTAGQWAKRNGIDSSTIDNRIKYGWTPEKAVSVPVKRKTISPIF